MFRSTTTERIFKMAKQLGKIFTYVHHTGKFMGWIELSCETDFAERTDVFNKIGEELAMHVATTDTDCIADLAKDPYVTDPDITVRGVINKLKEELSEDVQIKRFYRTNFGEDKT